MVARLTCKVALDDETSFAGGGVDAGTLFGEDGGDISLSEQRWGQLGAAQLVVMLTHLGHDIVLVLVEVGLNLDCRVGCWQV